MSLLKGMRDKFVPPSFKYFQESVTTAGINLLLTIILPNDRPIGKKSGSSALLILLANSVLRWFNKSGEKTVFGRISKICGKNTTTNLSAMRCEKFLTGNRSDRSLKN